MENLMVWKKSHELTLEIYKITKNYPKDELFGLTSQMRRASSSVPSNIIEGKARGSNNEFKRFLFIARGSLEELKYHLILSRDLEYISNNDYIKLNDMAKEVGRLLNGLIVSIDARRV